MKSDYELFLEYAKENKIELHLYQKQLAKALFENNEVIVMARQHGRSLGRRFFIEHLAKFQKELDDCNYAKEYSGHEQIINDLRDKGYNFCDMDIITYIERLERRCGKQNKYNYITDKCLYLLDRGWIVKKE